MCVGLATALLQLLILYELDWLEAVQMASWCHGVCVGAWEVVAPLIGCFDIFETRGGGFRLLRLRIMSLVGMRRAGRCDVEWMKRRQRTRTEDPIKRCRQEERARLSAESREGSDSQV